MTITNFIIICAVVYLFRIIICFFAKEVIGKDLGE